MLSRAQPGIYAHDDVGSYARLNKYHMSSNLLKLSATVEYIYAFLGKGFPVNMASNGTNLTAAPQFSLQSQSVFLDSV